MPAGWQVDVRPPRRKRGIDELPRSFNESAERRELRDSPRGNLPPLPRHGRHLRRQASLHPVEQSQTPLWRRTRRGAREAVRGRRGNKATPRLGCQQSPIERRLSTLIAETHPNRLADKRITLVLTPVRECKDALLLPFFGHSGTRRHGDDGWRRAARDAWRITVELWRVTLYSMTSEESRSRSATDCPMEDEEEEARLRVLEVIDEWKEVRLV